MGDVGGEHEFRSTYQGLGAFSAPGGGPDPSRRKWIVAAVVALVLALGGGATAYFLTRDGSAEADDPPPAPPTSTTTSPTSTTTGPTSTTTTPGTTELEPTVAGWQAVASAKADAAYDVPDDWRVESPDYISGFEDDGGELQVAIHGVSTYKPKACPEADGSIRGRTGFATPDGDDPAQAAERAAIQWVAAATGKDAADISPDEPSQVDIAEGDITATVVTAEAAAPQGSCSAPRVQVTAAAFQPPGGQTVLFVMYQDQGVDDALATDTAEKIVRSLRPHSSQPSG